MSKVEPGGKGFPEQDRPESKPTLKKNPEGLVRMRAQAEKDVINILWFRNGLRLHDNGSLHNATEDKTVISFFRIWADFFPVPVCFSE